MWQHTTPNQKTRICISKCNEDKNFLFITVLVWRWTFLFYYKSSLVCTWVPGKKRGMSTFVAGQITCSSKLTFQGILLSSWTQPASFEPKVGIFNFYQCTNSNLIFLDILWNIIILHLQERTWLNSRFSAFQTSASFSCEAQWAIFQCPSNTSCMNYRGADNIKHVP